MSKTLIKPVENGDFGEAQSSQCELRPTLAQPGWRWRNNPPLLVLDGWLAGKVSKSASSDLRGGVFPIIVFPMANYRFPPLHMFPY